MPALQQAGNTRGGLSRQPKQTATITITFSSDANSVTCGS